MYLICSRRHTRLGSQPEGCWLSIRQRCGSAIQCSQRRGFDLSGSPISNGRVQMAFQRNCSDRVVCSELLLQVHLLLIRSSILKLGTPSKFLFLVNFVVQPSRTDNFEHFRCGNVAAILELDEHLQREFTIFEAAPQVCKRISVSSVGREFPSSPHWEFRHFCFNVATYVPSQKSDFCWLPDKAPLAWRKTPPTSCSSAFVLTNAADEILLRCCIVESLDVRVCCKGSWPVMNVFVFFAGIQRNTF